LTDPICSLDHPGDLLSWQRPNSKSTSIRLSARHPPLARHLRHPRPRISRAQSLPRQARSLSLTQSSSARRVKPRRPSLAPSGPCLPSGLDDHLPHPCWSASSRPILLDTSSCRPLHTLKTLISLPPSFSSSPYILCSCFRCRPYPVPNPTLLTHHDLCNDFTTLNNKRLELARKVGGFCSLDDASVEADLDHRAGDSMGTHPTHARPLLTVPSPPQQHPKPLVYWQPFSLSL
jgi:hypothetical protein